jgi:hypothetical protein
MSSVYLDSLLMFVTFWGCGRIVKNPTKGNIVRMNLCLFTLPAFIWLRPPTATPTVWAAVAAISLFILVLTLTRARPTPPTDGLEKNSPPVALQLDQKQ